MAVKLYFDLVRYLNVEMSQTFECSCSSKYIQNFRKLIKPKHWEMMSTQSFILRLCKRKALEISVSLVENTILLRRLFSLPI